MPQGYLVENCAIDYVEAAATAATTTLTTDVLDMQGYDGVTFIAALGDVSDTSVLSLAVYEHTANAASGTAISGATAGATAGASDYDSKLLIVDVQKPSKRYVYATLARGTANAVVNGITAIRYKGSHSCPVTQGSTVMQLTKVQGGN